MLECDVVHIHPTLANPTGPGEKTNRDVTSRAYMMMALCANVRGW